MWGALGVPGALGCGGIGGPDGICSEVDAETNGSGVTTTGNTVANTIRLLASEHSKSGVPSQGPCSPNKAIGSPFSTSCGQNDAARAVSSTRAAADAWCGRQEGVLGRRSHRQAQSLHRPKSRSQTPSTKRMRCAYPLKHERRMKPKSSLVCTYAGAASSTHRQNACE